MPEDDVQDTNEIEPKEEEETEEDEEGRDQSAMFADDLDRYRS